MKYILSILVSLLLCACGSSNSTVKVNPTRSLNEVLACGDLAGLEKKYGKSH